MPFRSAKRSALVEEMLDAVDAQDFSDARVGQLSGGEQQRVLIAHALISRPRLSPSDEPLANLDIRSGQEIVELLKHIADEQQVVVLLSARGSTHCFQSWIGSSTWPADARRPGPWKRSLRPDVLSELYGHHVDVLRVHGRILVVAGHGSGDEAMLAESPTLLAASRAADLSLDFRARVLFEPTRSRRAPGRRADRGRFRVGRRVHRHQRSVLRRAHAHRRLDSRRLGSALDRPEPAHRICGGRRTRVGRDGSDRHPTGART